MQDRFLLQLKVDKVSFFACQSCGTVMFMRLGESCDFTTFDDESEAKARKIIPLLSRATIRISVTDFKTATKLLSIRVKLKPFLMEEKQ